MDHSQVIIRPVVSEKSYVLANFDRYTFRVHDKAHKTQIKQAVEALFDVNVVEVRTSKAAELLSTHRGGSVLVALADDELTAAKSFRNLSRVIVLHVDDIGVADLVRAATLVISQSALDNLTARARKEAKA